MTQDDYSPRYVSNLANPLQITLLDNENVPYDLSGLNTSTAFSLKLIDTVDRSVITGTGYWTIPNAAAGIAQYQWVSADVSIPGTYRIKIAVTFSSGVLTFDQKILEILP